MYKLIMVDDEEFVLENYANAVDWNSFGFDLIATFTNPTQAFDYISNHPVDAMISDIKMPHMSGIELAKQLYSSHPNLIIVLLSGYQDFAYAKEALQYNVFDYLLKPISFTSLQNLCERLYSKLENDRLLKEETEFPQDNTLILPQKIITDFLLGKISNLDEAAKLLQNCGLNIDAQNSPCAIINIEIEDLEEYLLNTWLYGKERLYNALHKLLVSDKMYLIPTKYTFDNIEYIAISKLQSIDNFTLNLIELQNSFILNSFEILNLLVHATMKQISSNLSMLNNPDQVVNIAKGEASALTKLVSAGEADTALKKLNDTMTIFQKDKDFIKFFAYNILLELCNLMGLDQLKEHNIFQETFDISSDLTKTTDALPDIIQKSAQYFNNKFLNESHIISKTKKYIDDHYMENITLSQVADYVFLSQSHFSRYFKKEVGENFIDYLNRVRIMKAQELLLNTRHNVNEICVMVGYNSTTYFYKKFKTQTGYTAQEYRNKFSGRNEPSA